MKVVLRRLLLFKLMHLIYLRSHFVARPYKLNETDHLYKCDYAKYPLNSRIVFDLINKNKAFATFLRFFPFFYKKYLKVFFNLV